MHHAENDRTIPTKHAVMDYEFAHDYCKQHNDLEMCRKIILELKNISAEMKYRKEDVKIMKELKAFLLKI